MMPEPVPVEDEEALPTDEEIRKRHTDNPEVMARAEEAAERVRRGEAASGDGITAEELPDFLRERSQRMDAR